MDQGLFASIPGLQEYFESLPPQVQGKLLFHKESITSLGELMQIAEHLRGQTRIDG